MPNSYISIVRKVCVGLDETAQRDLEFLTFVHHESETVLIRWAIKHMARDTDRQEPGALQAFGQQRAAKRAAGSHD